MDDLYDDDLVARSENQAELLRHVAAGERPNTVADCTTIAAEIGLLGMERARAL